MPVKGTSKSEKLLPIAVLISGAGTTLKNLIEKKKEGKLPVDFRLVISSNPQAGGLQHAAAAQIPAIVVDWNKYRDPQPFSEEIFDHCRRQNVKLVVMGGFLKRLVIPPDFENRVVNIHPALIPAFCGQGFYGLRVHQAVLDYGAKITGCTVHFADNLYDHGPIILQKVVPVLDDDTPETLAARVFQEECKAYPEAITLIAEGRVQVEGRKVKILPPNDVDFEL
ncbi:MAG: phosphoribosylglycinamide formyltransferase [Thermogutta sp.]